MSRAYRLQFLWHPLAVDLGAACYTYRIQLIDWKAGISTGRIWKISPNGFSGGYGFFKDDFAVTCRLDLHMPSTHTTMHFQLIGSMAGELLTRTAIEKEPQPP